VEPAQELPADRRPIDHRHPRIVGARWRVLPTTWCLDATARLTGKPIAASAQIERWGRAIAPDGPETAFACRWLPPSVWKAVNGDAITQPIARSEPTLPALAEQATCSTGAHGRGRENSPSCPYDGDDGGRSADDQRSCAWAPADPEGRPAARPVLCRSASGIGAPVKRQLRWQSVQPSLLLSMAPPTREAVARSRVVLTASGLGERSPRRGTQAHHGACRDYPD